MKFLFANSTEVIVDSSGFTKTSCLISSMIEDELLRGRREERAFEGTNLYQQEIEKINRKVLATKMIILKMVTIIIIIITKTTLFFAR